MPPRFIGLEAYKLYVTGLIQQKHTVLEIRQLWSQNHSVRVSRRTLERRLKSWNLGTHVITSPLILD